MPLAILYDILNTKIKYKTKEEQAVCAPQQEVTYFPVCSNYMTVLEQHT